MIRAIGHFLMWWPAVLGACFLFVVPPWGVLLAVIVVSSIVVGYHIREWPVGGRRVDQRGSDSG